MWLLVVVVVIAPSFESLVCNAEGGAVFHSVTDQIHSRGMSPASAARVAADGDQRVVAAASHLEFGVLSDVSEQSCGSITMSSQRLKKSIDCG